MANGLAPTHDGTGLLIMSGVRILRYDIASGAMDPHPFVEYGQCCTHRMIWLYFNNCFLVYPGIEMSSIRLT